MKLQQDTSAVTVRGAAGAPSDFGIVASKEAFKILSSGLYKQKVRACIRELCCNARDAHVAAGKAAVPFTLQLPTMFDLTFSVRDDGTGLSHEDVLSLYTTYFGTNKSDSNDYVGALGLGSKSPFCYTDMFSVTVRYAGDAGACDLCGARVRHTRIPAVLGANGEVIKPEVWYWKHVGAESEDAGDAKLAEQCTGYEPPVKPLFTRVYSCFISDQGKPAVVLQSEDETPLSAEGEDAVPGLEASFPVQRKDVWEFRNQAAEVLEFFDPAPVINARLDVVKQYYTIRTEQYGLRSRDNLGATGVRAIQGGVQYAVGGIDESKLDAAQQQALRLPLDLFFQIGDLDVTASRESLSQDERTVANVLRAVDGVRAGIVAEVRRQLSECKTVWEARVLLYSLGNDRSTGSIVLAAARAGELEGAFTGFTYREDDAPCILQTDYPNVEIAEFKMRYHSEWAKKSVLTVDLPDNAAAQLLLDPRLEKRWSVAFPVDDDLASVFVVNDLGYGCEKYLHNELQGRQRLGARRLYLLTRRHKKVTTEKVVSEAASILAALGNPPSVMMSTLRAHYLEDNPAAALKVPRNKLFTFDFTAYVAYKTYNGGTRCNWDVAWKACAADTAVGAGRKYYMVLKNRIPQTSTDADTAKAIFPHAEATKDFLATVRGAAGFGVGAEEVIYGVPVDLARKLDSSWVEVTAHVKKRLRRVLTPERERALSLALAPLESDLEVFLLELAERAPLDAASPLQRFAQRLAGAKAAARGGQVARLGKIVEWAQSNSGFQLTNTVAWGDELSAATAEYPLLNWLDSFHLDEEDTYTAAYDYCRMVDERRARRENFLTGATFAGAVVREDEESYAN
jgi:hypothetical protein